jgi:non-ribosomal peptide synthetase component F
LTEEEADALMEHAFERYFETSGLFGTPESCLPLLESLKEIDIDEIACLIDFGIDTDTVLASLPHLDALQTIANPAAVEVPATERATVGELIRRHQVTHMQCTPSMATLMLSDPDTRRALADLDHLLIGGEAFPPALADSLSQAGVKTITNMYGPTETTIWSTAHRLNGAGDGIPIGRPIANTEIYVLDRDGQPAPVGVTGELFIGGLGVVRGYLNRPDLTAERFVPHAFTDGADARLYRTGDVVRYRDDGVIDFLGRVDHQVKVRGYRIELGEIESRLTEHSGVAEAIVIAKGDGDDRRLVGYIVADGEAPGTEELKAHLRHALPEFMVPGHIISLDRLPLTPNAKVDRNALPDPETVTATASPDEAFVAPTSDIEQQVAAVWQDVLKVPQVGLEDNFFDLGGHSLLVVQTHRRLKDDLNLELSITDMFRFPTVRSLASFLDGGDADTASVEQGVDRAAGRRAALKRRRGRRV